MTLEQAKRIYTAAGGPSSHTAGEWEDIRTEMEQVVAAKSDRAAGLIIIWWDCWDRKHTATAFARQVRDEWARIKDSHDS